MMLASLKDKRGYVGATLLVIICLLTFDSPIVRSDGLGYYMWLNSFAQDADFDLANQVARYHPTYQVFLSPVTGQYVSPFPFGTALVWLPFYKIALLLENVLPPIAADDAYLALHGEHFIRTFAVMLGTNVCGVLAALLAASSARTVCSRRAASVSAVALFVGTPLLYYASIEPSMSHAASAFAVALVIWRYVRQKRASVMNWLILGGLTGFASLIRWQNMAVALPLMLLCLAESSIQLSRRLQIAMAYLIGTIALTWPIPLLWYWSVGSPFTMPTAAQLDWPLFMGPVHVPQVLFSDHRGLFVWAPILLFAVPGMLLLWRRNRKLTFLLGCILLLELLINSSIFEWDGGWAFGQRRLADYYPVFVIGFACVVDFLASRTGRSARAGRAIFWTLSASMIIFSLYLMVMFATNMISPDTGNASEAVAYLGHNPSARVLATIMTHRYGIWAWATPGY